MASWTTCYKITKRRTSLYNTDQNKAVWANYARDLLIINFKNNQHPRVQINKIELQMDCIK